MKKSVMDKVYKRMKSLVSYLKNSFLRWLTAISPELNTRIIFRLSLGYNLNFKNPKTLNEKLQYLKLFYYSGMDDVTRCVDKYLVRSFVAEKGLSHTLTKLYGVWENANEIPWDKLPNNFVIKCNHGSGYNIICEDKTQFDTNIATELLNRWLVSKYGREHSEMVYEKIQPRIICEELIQTNDGLPPKDYKVFCSYGKPMFLFVAQDRINNNTKFDFYDTRWNWIDVRNGHSNAPQHLEKPNFLEELLKSASILAEDYPIVRIDFYHENQRLYFGEMTFLHFGGVTPFQPSNYDTIFGELFPIQDLVMNKV